MEVDCFVLDKPLKKGRPVGYVPTANEVDKIEVAKARINAMMLEDHLARQLLQSPDKQFSSPDTAKLHQSEQKMASTTSGNESSMLDRTGTTLFNEEEESDDEFPLNDDNNSIASSQQNSVSLASDSQSEVSNEGGPNRTMRDQFREYATYMRHHSGPLAPEEITSIKLLNILKEKKAPLNTFEDLMVWHLVAKGELKEGQKLGDHPGYCGRNTLLKKLKKCYNMDKKFAFKTKVKLPHSGQWVELTRHDFLQMVQSILTDPNLKDEDFDFTDNDPFAPPPEKPVWIEGLRTGEAYRASYKEYITKPNQILLPIPFYIDGTQTASLLTWKLKPCSSHLEF